MMIITLRHIFKCQPLQLNQACAYRHMCHAATLTTPVKRYSALLQEKIINPDKEQFQAVLKVQEVFNELRTYDPLTHGQETIDRRVIPKGFYLHGGVGTGKTMILDLFYDNIPTTMKKRVHFHQFMLYLYSEFNRWNLAVDDDVDFVTPTEHIANKIMDNTWLLCFDEIQLADYASCTLLQGVFSHMLAKGAVIVGTSNRAPEELGDISITDKFDGEIDNISDTINSFKAIFQHNCHVHEMNNQRDHRNEMKAGEERFFAPCTEENMLAMDGLFARNLQLSNPISSAILKLYGRKILIPISAGHVARFTFNDLCCQPLGPADYIKICNTYKVVFIDNIPKLTMNTKNEARRFITFIDAAYESHVQLYCTAMASYNDIFLLLPRDDDNYQPEQMHMEMIGEIAYDLQIHGLDFKSLNIISGKDEIFSFERAVSRLQEMQSALYQSRVHRAQEFVPYLGTAEEVGKSVSKRSEREQRRQERFRQIMEEEGKTDTDAETNDGSRRHNLSMKETDWADEASYKSLSKETSTVWNRHVNIDPSQDNRPKFNEQHFWGFGWWEKVKGKWKKR